MSVDSEYLEYTPQTYDDNPDNKSWGHAIPSKQGLYDPDFEKDACGVGFACNIKGEVSHKIISDGQFVLCNMTHRGAVGSDARDGDGAGVMTSIPHKFMAKEFGLLGVEVPSPGQYAVGNLFFSKDADKCKEQQTTFESLASSLGISILGWRSVPRDSTLLGPASLSREPQILQPLGVLKDLPPNLSDEEFELQFARRFARQLYVLRKTATHKLGIANMFYICSFTNKNIVYKGQLSPIQVYRYYYDLMNVDYEGHFALVHSRFSTNTFPSWDRAQPLRWAAHNGEINTLRGNKNWMKAREGLMQSKEFNEELEQLYPIIEEGGSDSAAFDNVLELLLINGVLSLPEAVMLMIPEAWQNNSTIDSKKKAFYQWAGCLMEPWDGPALFTFADGRYCGANLDRNGLRPCRFYVTNDNRMICASEVGVLPIDPAIVVRKGRLRPGRMLLVDTKLGIIVDDRELKAKVSERVDFKSWLSGNLIDMPDLLERSARKGLNLSTNIDMSTTVQTDPRIKAFGYTYEQIVAVLTPMIRDAKEPLGSMGNDAGLACLTPQPKLVYEYFRQLFAQVTNPPIDPIREAVVMSLECYVGPQGNMLEMAPSQCARFHLKSPILSITEMNAIRNLPLFYPKWTIGVIDITFDKSEGINGYTKALDRVIADARQAVANENTIILLSDRQTSSSRVAISTLVAAGAVHHSLVNEKLRSKIALFVETAEAREVHHICALLGYGVDAICPYLAMETFIKMNKEGLVLGGLSDDQIIANYCKAANEGILKVMAKMGISTLASYKGAQIFEILGIKNDVVDKCFTGTASRIQGIGFDELAKDALVFHEQAYPSPTSAVFGEPQTLKESGEYHWRKGGVSHVNTPTAIADLRDAVKNKNEKAYEDYAREENNAIRECTLRGLLDFDYENSEAISIDQVEPWTEIVRRFVTGAMSYGSISMEAHSTLAVAMNRLGAKSNTGEGGEDPERSIVNAETGDTMRSAIKQVASSRFGVTSLYLSDADELQIKMAQGAKPGEGGELPGHKVSKSIARTRHSTRNVGLISPPPHHDIYSIEDLKQLIYDLKCSNPRARVSVKLVSEVGVGIIASGVAKAKADHVLISGHDGGTGASRLTGIKYAGLPWELGLAETHQTLVLNDLRGRITVQTDGQLKTGRDVAIACLLGAEEWGFATTPLIAMGCIMMRKCHLNTCPVGIATQDPELRKKFEGTPEHVINFFYYVAQELRGIMAKLGFRNIDEMVGRAEKLKVNDSLRTAKTANIDLSPLLTPAHLLRPGVATRKVRNQDYRLHVRLDNKLIDESEVTLDHGLPTRIQCDIINTDRALGTTLSYRISKKFGEQGLPKDTIHVDVSGSAGQSFGAFLAPGVTLELEGDANDYVGKGLSGGDLIIYPPQNSKFASEENIIIGNTCLYGATSGTCFFNGIAAERFAVRNSGATAVVEGVGDHGCEYMTGGRVVVLGPTGRNFAAGMSGGIAYVLDIAQEFTNNVNKSQVELCQVVDPTEIAFLRGLIEDHRHYTGSDLARRVLADFNRILPLFVKVFPHDYKRVLEEEAQKKEVERKREMDDYMRPYKEDPSADATNGEALRISKSSLVLKDQLVEQPSSLREPKVADLEDTVMDTSKHRTKPKLDKLRGFKLYKRRNESYRHSSTRTKDWAEISHRLTKHELQYQTARCMDCGVPFCQSDTGCPISNIIPKWNELVFKDRWYDALQRLLMTNNFPEFTGRVCPAPCEGACVLGISEDPVGIKSVEAAIIDYGFDQGWIQPYVVEQRNGKSVAVIGSGPAGLACADQLNRAGYTVTIFEREDKFGGLLMYGIPNMKLDKRLVDRRVKLLESSGINFVNNACIGVDMHLDSLKEDYDAVVMAIGSTIPRDLNIKGRSLNNIKYAMELLKWNTKALLNQELPEVRSYLENKRVIVIGGGDTGNDCLGTAVRHGAKSVVNFELMPKPPTARARDNPWPQWPKIFRVDYGHNEVKAHYGRDPREFCVMSKEFIGDDEGNVTGIKTVRVEWKQSESGAWQMSEVPGSEEFFQADVVLLSMGFIGPEAQNFDLKCDSRGNFVANDVNYHAEDNVFAAGDCRRGQSLIVWAIQEGRQCARQVDIALGGASMLPASGSIVDISSTTEVAV